MRQAFALSRKSPDFFAPRQICSIYEFSWLALRLLPPFTDSSLFFCSNPSQFPRICQTPLQVRSTGFAHLTPVRRNSNQKNAKKNPLRRASSSHYLFQCKKWRSRVVAMIDYYTSYFHAADNASGREFSWSMGAARYFVQPVSLNIPL